MAQLVMAVLGGMTYAYLIAVLVPRMSRSTRGKAFENYILQMDAMQRTLVEAGASNEERKQLRRLCVKTRDHFYLKAHHEELAKAPGMYKASLLMFFGRKWMGSIRFLSNHVYHIGTQEEERFVQALVGGLVPEVYTGMTEVSKPDTNCNTMFIITRGLLAALGVIYHKDQVVGDDIVLTPWNVRRHYPIHALNYVEAMTLEWPALLEILERGNFMYMSNLIRRFALRLLMLRTLREIALKIKIVDLVNDDGQVSGRSWLNRISHPHLGRLGKSQPMQTGVVEYGPDGKPIKHGPDGKPRKRGARHFFLSHKQDSGGDQMSALYFHLAQHGFRCWYDNQEDQITKQAMEEGVNMSQVFVLFLSKGVLQSKWVQYEVATAMRKKKRIVLLHEADERFGR